MTLPCGPRRRHWATFLAMLLALFSSLFQGVASHRGATTFKSLKLMSSKRSLQVTGALDWPPSHISSNDSDSSTSQEQRTQEDTTSLETAAPTEASSTNDEAATLTESSQLTPLESKSGLSIGKIILGVLVFGVLAFVILVLKRRQELARWHEYRTHQLLRAQDEAFDTNYDEAFDLELVEGSNGGTLS